MKSVKRLPKVRRLALASLMLSVIAAFITNVAFAGAPGQPNNNGIAGLNRNVVGIASTPSGNGYWLVAGDGGVFTFGDARFLGSTGGIRLNQPVVGMAATPSGNGYWLVARDGGIFSFGDARFYGSTGGIRLNQPVVGMAASPSGNGYWLVASDGGIFTFGGASFQGSAGGMRTGNPIVGMAASPSGAGYLLVGTDGTVYAFGTTPFAGSGVGCVPGPVVGIALRNDRYWIAGAAAQTGAFAQGYEPSCASGPPPVVPDGTPGSPAEARVAADIFDRLNAERAARGLHPLRWDGELANRALDWSVQMKQSAGFRHSDLQPLLGRFYIAAENIGTGPIGVTSGSMHSAWMRSTTHRVNLLAPNLEVVGVGVYCAPDGSMWVTQNFGRFPDSTLPWDFGPTPPENPIIRNDTGGPSCR